MAMIAMVIALMVQPLQVSPTPKILAVLLKPPLFREPPLGITTPKD
jgi:hypothetical protein